MNNIAMSPTSAIILCICIFHLKSPREYQHIRWDPPSLCAGLKIRLLYLPCEPNRNKNKEEGQMTNQIIHAGAQAGHKCMQNVWSTCDFLPTINLFHFKNSWCLRQEAQLSRHSQPNPLNGRHGGSFTQVERLAFSIIWARKKSLALPPCRLHSAICPLVISRFSLICLHCASTTNQSAQGFSHILLLLFL